MHKPNPCPVILLKSFHSKWRVVCKVLPSFKGEQWNKYQVQLLALPYNFRKRILIPSASFSHVLNESSVPILDLFIEHAFLMLMWFHSSHHVWHYTSICQKAKHKKHKKEENRTIYSSSRAKIHFWLLKN